MIEVLKDGNWLGRIRLYNQVLILKKIGGSSLSLAEPPNLVITRFYGILWGQKRFDYARLARLREIEDWSVERLAEHYGVSQQSIQRYLRRAKDRK